MRGRDDRSLWLQNDQGVKLFGRRPKSIILQGLKGRTSLRAQQRPKREAQADKKSWEKGAKYHQNLVKIHQAKTSAKDCKKRKKGLSERKTKG